MLDIHVHSPQEFRETLFLMKERFPDVIKHYESMTVFEERVIRYVLDAPTADLKDA
jgi:uncharacterized membrane protein